jgi:hypothetical protein
MREAVPVCFSALLLVNRPEQVASSPMIDQGTLRVLSTHSVRNGVVRCAVAVFNRLNEACLITDSHDDVTPTTLDAWLAAKQQSTKHIPATALDMNWWAVEVNRHAHSELQHAPSAHG